MDNKIHILGIPMDLGQGRRGVDMGPSAVRYAGINQRLEALGYQTVDHGNVDVAQAEEIDDIAPFEEVAPLEGNARYLNEVANVCRRIYEKGLSIAKADERLIFIGGDHSVSIGTVAAVSQNEPVGVLWVDAHADINTPRTSPSGNIHGMPVAALLGDGPEALTQIGGSSPRIRAEQVAMVGIRDLDAGERRVLREKGILVYTMRQVDEMGIARVMEKVVEHMSRYAHIHVSFDLDSLDPEVAPGVGTPVPGGLTYRETHLLMEMLADTNKVRSMDIVEINPILDQENTTAKIAVEMVASLFGQRII